MMSNESTHCTAEVEVCPILCYNLSMRGYVRACIRGRTVGCSKQESRSLLYSAECPSHLSVEIGQV